MRKILTLLMLGGGGLFCSIFFGFISASLYCNQWPCAGSGLFLLFAVFAIASLVYALVCFGNALARYLNIEDF